MSKNILSPLLIALALFTGCKSEYFKDKVIGFTDQGIIKEPPYVWNEFQSGGSISGRKIELEGEIRDPLLVEEGIIYVGQDSGVDELFHYDTQFDEISRLTFRRQTGRKSPIYSLRLSNAKEAGHIVSGSAAWIEKADNQENSWDIYVGKTYWDNSPIQAKKIHRFTIPTSDSNKINEYLESLQITSDYLFWTEPTQDMSSVNIYRYEWQSGEILPCLTDLNSTKFLVSGGWILYEKIYCDPSLDYSSSTWRKTHFSTDYSIGLINSLKAGPFIKDNLIIWQTERNHIEFENLDRDVPRSDIYYFLKFTSPTNNDILLQKIQNNILYFKGHDAIYALDTNTLKRTRIVLLYNDLNKINYYKNRFVTYQRNGTDTDLYLYEVSF